MRHLFHSLQWRLQVWHGVILLAVLIFFGAPAYFFNADMRNRSIDLELRRRQMAIADRTLTSPWREAFHGPPGPMGDGLRRPIFPDFFREPGPAMPEIDQRPGPMPPRERPMDDGFSFSTNPSSVRSTAVYYYAIWSADRKLAVHSDNIPPDLIAPDEPPNYPFYIRNRGEYREFVTVGRGGLLMVVGRSIARDKAELRQYATVLIAAGAGVLLLGLAGGWWLASRAIRPIKNIGETAEKIAHGNLSERIDVADTDNELGQLAKILNHTFERLHDAFERQARFTSDASHELRTPVAVVLMQAQSALSGERSPEEYRQALIACADAAQRMRRLIEALLTLARMDSGQRGRDWKHCELGTIVRDAVKLLEPLAQRKNVCIRQESAPAACVGDAEQLGLVISNLVTNAIQYNHPGGEVNIVVTATAEEAVLVVSDTGQGIAEDDLPRIFERFYRTDKARSHGHQNHGLGLAITDAVVKAHGGRIQVKSVPGAGSVFTVRLPVEKPGISQL